MVDKQQVFGYNSTTDFCPYGDVKVSTGMLRYDKRGGLSNPVTMLKLKQ